MPFYDSEAIERARQVDLLTYLQTCEPQELVHVSGNVYCTKTHDSLRISNGKYDLLKHPNIKYTTDGGAAAFTHGGTENAVADMVIGRLTPGDLANIQEPETLYELLSDEDMENIFQLKEDTQNETV